MVRANGDIERLHNSVLHEILKKLDVETLCSAATLSRTLRFSVSQALSSISTLDLSGFSPDANILNCLLRDNHALNSLTLDCRRLDDSSVSIITRNHLRELILLRCSLFSSWIFTSIGDKCPKLRVLTLEIVHQAELESAQESKRKLGKMLKGCLYLESLCIKFQGLDLDRDVFESVELFLPKTIKILQLQPMYEQHVRQLIRGTVIGRDSTASSVDSSIPSSLGSTGFQLQSLSLILNYITDELLICICGHLCLLVKLDLGDKPTKEPSLLHDLTNNGLQLLRSCIYLTHLSLTRSREHFLATFRRVNDVGMFLLAEGCKGLKSVRLGGFSRVTDAGFASILHSCKSLNKFEIVNGYFLSDLAFHDLANGPCSLIDVRLALCGLITSEAGANLASCKNLEVLDMWGCKSMADRGLIPISNLSRLTTLNLGGADITDNGLSILGSGKSPIVSLRLRGCKRVTDRGVVLMLCGGGIISKTLSLLDMGHIPGISDRAIFAIVNAGIGITDLCIRYCFHVTDASIAALASAEGVGGRRRWLRRLDLCHCNSLSRNLVNLLKRPSFRGLRWLGIGRTCLAGAGDTVLAEIFEDRPWLSLCLNGCDMGCYDGWQFH